MFVHDKTFSVRQQHGLLTLIGKIVRKVKGTNRVFWLCECACGKRINVLKTDLQSERSVASCGCYVVSKRNKPFRWQDCEDCCKSCFVRVGRFKRCLKCAADAKVKYCAEYWIDKWNNDPEFRHEHTRRKKRREIAILKKQVVRAQAKKAVVCLNQLLEEKNNVS